MISSKALVQFFDLSINGFDTLNILGNISVRDWKTSQDIP